jgi:hypothetical protein
MKFSTINLQVKRLHMFDMLLIGALLAQIPHAAEVFARIAPVYLDASDLFSTHLHSFAYAVALEGATYYFVTKGRRQWAYGFAVFSVLHNVAYYMPVDGFFGVTRYFFSATIVCIALPLAIAAFSEERHKTDGAKQTQQDAKIPTVKPSTPQEEQKAQESPVLPIWGHFNGTGEGTIVTVVDDGLNGHDYKLTGIQRIALQSESDANDSEPVQDLGDLQSLAPKERREAFAELIAEGGVKTQTELARLAGVSVATVSRDLQHLGITLNAN